ncbi:hypothetical protein RHSIM_RhsimUnG0079200 [Rhododendron simsii]|uniref:Protein kinase domain-containing protein n=1 Tax=Rhododendron simsii TaxID=118357 RepID=A0A834L564_RHOSS|nr:hypothetical protein RHSIM_RhsimUnG0079200 [Rhododendron simsii]
MSAGLYHAQEGDAGAHVVGQNFRLPIDKSIALEMVQRLNVGGTAISSKEDTDLFRDWSQDSNSLMETSYVQPVTTTLYIKYTRTYLMMEGDRMVGKHNLLITYFPHNNEWIEHIDAVLQGLEVFKLSNPDQNLAGVNPMPLASASTSSITTPRKFVYASSGNTIATVLVILLSTMNILVYKLRIWGEKLVGKKSISPLPSEGLCHRFSLSEVLSMTNNFDDELVIGSGGFGNIYKGFIDDGTTIFALKRLKSKSNQGADEFQTEIEMLSNLRHMHLVNLIGYCDERKEMILVYEYTVNRTLADHLYKHYPFGNGTICQLSWMQTMKICIRAARGLDYLHTGIRRGIIRRDVKTTNILLDKDWVAKISNFGLCKVGTTSHSHTHISTAVKGTFGYLDPEYFLTRRLTKKSDVYAFGVMLLEVLCGRPTVDLRLEEEQHSLTRWARQCIKEEKLD